MHVIGIDAGGTKTVCLLADERGVVLSDARGPGANLHAAGELEVEAVLRDAIAQATGGGRIKPDAICLGIAGVDRADEAQTIYGIVRRIATQSRVLVVNDALIALVAGVDDAPGIVIVAGTGSIAYGRNERGQAARAGGWGHMIGDEGSGYWIGREALAAVTRGVDGRGPATPLAGEILAHFGIDDFSRLSSIVYDREQPRTAVAVLAAIVQRASAQGDAVASRILERAADELALAAQSVAAELEMRGDAFTFVLAGGVFRVVPWMVQEMPRRLIEVAPRGVVKVLEAEPAVGAVRLALAEARGGVRVPAYRTARR